MHNPSDPLDLTTCDFPKQKIPQNGKICGYEKKCHKIQFYTIFKEKFPKCFYLWKTQRKKCGQNEEDYSEKN